jgi:hypothetical protein
MLRASHKSGAGASRSIGFGTLVRLAVGRPSGRAAFGFVTTMAARDWQFRRFALQAGFGLIILIASTLPKLDAVSPFADRLGASHFLPHCFGLAFLFLCSILIYSDHYRAAWIFLTVPMDSLRAFVHGIYWALWALFIALPHLFIMGIASWYWGSFDAVLFVAYSVALVSLYLAACMWLVDGLPFGSQPKTTRSTITFPLAVAAFVVIGIFVLLQFLIIFRDRLITLAATLVFGLAAYVIAQISLRTVEFYVKQNLRVISTGPARMFKEVES